MLKKISILSLLVVTILLKGEGEYEGRLEETVVTATGFSETIGNQTKNITIITREEIQNKGYNTVEEVLRKAPGINIVKTGFGSAIDVRGQGKMGTANLPKGVSNVKIIIDGGVSMDTLEISHAYIPLNTISVNDIERIEIINGGGTVLYGSGTRGGVINIITRNRNKEGASGKAYAQGGSYNTTKIGVNTGINLNNKLIFDLGYENINGKGYREKEKSSSEYLKGGLTFNITNNHTLKFKVTDAPINMMRMIVRYDDGGAPENIDLRFNIPQGGESRVIDLRGGRRKLKSVEFWYDTKGILNGRADVTLFGLK